MFLLAKMFKRNVARSSYQLSDMVGRLLYTKFGQIIQSILFGVALALMFHKVCKDRKCIVIQAPPMKEIEQTIYDMNGTCYRYTPKVVACMDDESK